MRQSATKPCSVQHATDDRVDPRRSLPIGSHDLLRVGALGLFLALGVGCSADSPVGVQPVEDVGSSLATCTTGTNLAGTKLVCGQTTWVSIDSRSVVLNDTSNEITSLKSVVANWRNAVLNTSPYNMPRLEYRFEPPPGANNIIRAWFRDSGASVWCGSGDTQGFEVWAATAGNCSYGPGNPSLEALLSHELGDEAFRLSRGVVAPSVETECPSNNGSGAVFPCRHEVQQLYVNAGFRDPIDWTAELIYDVSIAGPTSLQFDGTASYEAEFVETGGGGGPIVPLVSPDSDGNQVSAVAGVKMSAVLSNAVHWTGPGLSISNSSANPTSVTGTSQGAYNLTVDVLPATNVVWPEPGDSKTVNVEPPPPPPEPEVASIQLSPALVFVGQPPPPTVTGTARDASGNIIPDVSFDWSIANTSIAYLGTSTGTSVQVWPNQNGRTTLTATAGSASASARVVVDCGPFACF